MGHSRRIRFPNGRGDRLAGIIEIPAGEASVRAVFSHCFTCTKDLKAIVRISRRLAAAGFAVLRYDCTGLGDSEGDFSQTNFSTVCQDLAAAADCLTQEVGPPQLLIGHSFGGAASLVTAPSLATVQAVVTIAAPSDTHHLATLLSQMDPAIDARGTGSVTIGGRTYSIRRQMLENLRSVDMESALSQLERPVLVFHSPVDQTLPFQHARQIFDRISGPATLVCVDGADHLLVDQPGDVTFVGDMIVPWARRYIDPPG